MSAKRSSGNLSGIDFERSGRLPHRPGFFGRLIGVIVTLAGILIVVWLLFNPVRTRPTAAAYIESFNRIAAAQGMADRLEGPPPDPAAGTRTYALAGTGLALRIDADADGYVTALAVMDDPAAAPPGTWLALSPRDLRDRFAVMLDALDARWTVVALYRAFSAMGVDLDQPLADQPGGQRTHATDGLNLRLTHDGRHMLFEAQLDVLQE